MNELKQNMINLATVRYNAIFPCASKRNLGECFTLEGNQMLFWFNTADQSTHVLAQDINR